MKRNFLGIITVIIVVVAVGYNIYAIQNKKTRLTDLTLFNIEALAQNEGGNYSCTVTVDCGFPLSGSISCTGNVCERGLDWSNGAYVECDGNRTYC